MREQPGWSNKRLTTMHWTPSKALADTDLMPRGTHTHTHKQRGIISWKPGRACMARRSLRRASVWLSRLHTRLSAHPPLFAAIVSSMHNTYTHIRLQWRRGCGGRSVRAAALLPRACIPWPLATVPLGHHPRLVRIARNSPVLQKWYKRIIYLHLSCWCIVVHSWRRTLAYTHTHTTSHALRCERRTCGKGGRSHWRQSIASTRLGGSSEPHYIARPCHRNANTDKPGTRSRALGTGRRPAWPSRVGQDAQVHRSSRDHLLDARELRCPAIIALCHTAMMLH